jgi:hypothetical protein
MHEWRLIAYYNTTRLPVVVAPCRGPQQVLAC